MRRALLAATLLLSLAAASQAHAQHTPSAEETAANAVDPARVIIHGRDVKPVTVYQWERNGQLLHAWPGQEKDIPYDASRVAVRLYNFPTGQLRLIDFPKGTRTHWHTNESDIIFYAVSVHQVEFVGQQVFDSFPGDVTMHPAYVRHHSESITGGTEAEFAFGPSGRAGDDMIAYAGRAQWLRDWRELVENGERKVALAGEGDKGADGKAAGRYQAKSFVFPGYRLVEAHYPAGETVAPHTNTSERLAYVLSGKLRVILGDKSDELGPGDMMRMAAGQRFARTALSDAVVLELDGATAP